MKLQEISYVSTLLYLTTIFLLIIRFVLIKYTIFTQFVLLLRETGFAAKKRNKELLNERKPWFIFVLFYGDV